MNRAAAEGFAARGPARENLPSSSEGSMLHLGNRVIVNVQGYETKGVIRFLGQTAFSSGDWVGVALDEARGKNDGALKGVRYFQSKAMHGIFVRTSAVKLDTIPSRVLPSSEIRTNSLSPLRTDRWVTPLQPRSRTPGHGIKLQPSRGCGPPCPPDNMTPGKVTPGKQDIGPPETSEKSDERVSFVTSDRQTRAIMQRQLTKAIEDEDIDCLNSLLPAANRIGMWSHDFERAQRMVNFKIQKQLLSELEAVRAIMKSLTASLCIRGVDHGTTGKLSATIDIEEMSKAGASAQVPQSWSKMFQDSICEGIDEHVREAARTAVAEASKEATKEATNDVLLESQELQEMEPVDCQEPDVSEEVDKPETSTLVTSAEFAELVAKGLQLLQLKTEAPLATPKYMTVSTNSLDSSIFSDCQEESGGITQWMTSSVPEFIAENTSWPTTPSAIRESFSQAKMSSPGKWYRKNADLL